MAVGEPDKAAFLLCIELALVLNHIFRLSPSSSDDDNYDYQKCDHHTKVTSVSPSCNRSFFAEVLIN